MQDQDIIYEQPLHEHIRVCLRLEYLFQQALHYINNQTSWGSRMAINTILQILNVIDRPDLKSKLVTALGLHASALQRLESIPNIDTSTLHKILDQLDRLSDMLHGTHGKMGQQLRENEFLTSIKQRLTIPGGTCNFCIPAYNYWLEQSPQQRSKDLNNWFQEFAQLREIVELLIKLIREGTALEPQTAPNGFYQDSLDSNTPYQIIRVAIPKNIKLYPEISVGRFRLSIHFYTPDINAHDTQITDDTQFKLACCKI